MSKQKAKGTAFETDVARFLEEAVGVEVSREPLRGQMDRGDLRGIELFGSQAVLECKNRARTDLAEWVDEADREAENAGSPFGFVVHKRRGCGDAKFGKTYVTCSLETWARLAGCCIAVSKMVKKGGGDV